MNRISNFFILLSNKQQQYGNTRTSKILNWLPNVQLGDKILTQEKLPTTTDPGNKDIHPYLTLCPTTHFSVFFPHISEASTYCIALHCIALLLHGTARASPNPFSLFSCPRFCRRGEDLAKQNFAAADPIFLQISNIFGFQLDNSVLSAIPRYFSYG